ncbi:tannase/feruloyl esterase family alpha/beta hydrolase [Variovorax sp. UC122_21]|uniref:tannase/feruloyl esterase family alpha/beta hydrolase n=1 Tax=Variovorax sp. UC122_21 TaxID=3374554 RepID=UPI0037577D52
MASRTGKTALLGMGLAALLAGCGGGGGGGGGFLPLVLPPAPPPAPPSAPPPTPPARTAQALCDLLAGKTIDGAVVQKAAVVAAADGVPAYCQVQALMSPKLNLALRLPEGWNGKLVYSGGGGYNGEVPAANTAALSMGFANVSSDSGHQGSGVDASWALNDPYAAQLFGSLSVPTVMAPALQMLTVAYGNAPARSYFEGCSNGGREALMNAQRYPNLFDGIIARAPAYNWVGFMGHFNRTAKAIAAPGGLLSAAKISTLAAAVRGACDANDGIVDGVVSNPSCSFDPAVLRCAGGGDTGDSCLSDAQLAVVSSWTSPAVWAGGAYRNAGWPLSGNEDDVGAWPAWVTGIAGPKTAAQYLFQDTTVKTYLARDLGADSLAYAPYDQDPQALFGLEALNSATSTDLRPYFGSSGKLILWHGGNDSALSVNTTTEYFQNLKTTLGAATVEANVRYYVAPGVNHCAGGPGADTTNLLAALDTWVGEGKAPETLVAAKIDAGKTSFSRPLCRHPQYPRYTGPAGDAAAAKLAASYTCTTP